MFLALRFPRKMSKFRFISTLLLKAFLSDSAGNVFPLNAKLLRGTVFANLRPSGSSGLLCGPVFGNFGPGRSSGLLFGTVFGNLRPGRGSELLCGTVSVNFGPGRGSELLCGPASANFGPGRSSKLLFGPASANFGPAAGRLPSNHPMLCRRSGMSQVLQKSYPHNGCWSGPSGSRGDAGSAS